MDNFEFNSVGRVIFGRGQSRRLGETARGLGATALVVYNGDGVGERAAALLASSGVRAALRRQRGEPVVADIDTAVEQARRDGCDLIVGIGGGSAIDAAKAVAGLLGNGGSAVDYMEVVGKGQKITQPAAPWVAVPTTAGTGAEATRNAVIGLPERQFKASIRSELLLPRVALIDPELGLEVPPEVTARSGMDALCQLIESYTSTGANPITDALALQGMTLAARSLPKAYRDGHDLAAREEMALAAYLSGVTLTNAGLGAVHGLAAPLGANYPVPHGAVCAALLPPILAANIAQAIREGKAELLSRYATVGRTLSGLGYLADVDAHTECVDITTELLRDLNIPPLLQFGVREQDVPAMIALGRKASSMRYNPVTLTDAALAGALIAAIRGG